MFLRGPNQLRCQARTDGTGFATSVFLFFAVYYGIQHAEYGYGLRSRDFAVLTTPANERLTDCESSPGETRGCRTLPISALLFLISDSVAGGCQEMCAPSLRYRSDH